MDIKVRLDYIKSELDLKRRTREQKAVLQNRVIERTPVDQMALSSVKNIRCNVWYRWDY